MHFQRRVNPPLFRDRSEAGKMLAAKLQEYGGENTLVLALPRGGVPVGYEIASALNAPLDVFIVRKLGVPSHEELAMGALATGGMRVLNEEVIRSLNIPQWVIEEVTVQEQAELERRQHLYCGARPEPDPAEMTVIVVDDGLATGSTMKAAVRALQAQKPGSIIVAVPVAAPSICAEIATEANDAICLFTPEPFYSVGLWYQDFTQTSDDEVRLLLSVSRLPPHVKKAS